MINKEIKPKKTVADLRAFQSLQLDQLEMWFVAKVEEFLEFAAKQNRPVYNSFSGGLDSTIGRYIIEKHFPKEIDHVFSNTGLEFRGIVDFARRHCTAEIKPKKSFKKVVKDHGYPAVSKIIARSVHDMQNPTENNVATRKLRMTGIKIDGTLSKGGHLPKKWHHLISGPKLGEGCCNVLKKEPLARYARENGHALPIIGVRAEESQSRQREWCAAGCNTFSAKLISCRPLMIWTHQRVLEYLRKFDVEYCREIYGDIVEKNGRLVTTGESSTGCAGCLFGCDRDPERFVRLYRIDPAMHKYCMDAGAREVLKYLQLPAYPGQYKTVEMF